LALCGVSTSQRGQIDPNLRNETIVWLLYQGTTLVGPTSAQLNGLQPLRFVSGHDFSRAVQRPLGVGFSPRDRVPHICPVLADVGPRESARLVTVRGKIHILCQGTTSVVASSAQLNGLQPLRFVSGHGFSRAEMRPLEVGFSPRANHVVPNEVSPRNESGFVSGHDFSRAIQRPLEVGFSPCERR
jgi:hypothetical protein